MGEHIAKTFGKGLTTKMYKVHTKLNTRKTNKPI